MRRWLLVFAIGSVATGLALIGWFLPGTLPQPTLHPQPNQTEGEHQPLQRTPLVQGPEQLEKQSVRESEATQPSVAGQVEALPSSPVGWRRRTLEAVLRFNPQITPTSAVIGMGRVEDQDLRDDAESGDATHVETNLVNYTSWMEVSLHRGATGDWLVGPAEVPEALAYRILAWGERGYYLEDAVPSQTALAPRVDAGILTPTLFTGLRLSLRQSKVGPYAVLLGRNPDPDWSEDDSQLSQVLSILAPETKKYYAGRPIPLTVEPFLLAPMYPDPSIFLTLETQAGTRSKPIEIMLEREQITPVLLDPEELFEQGTHGMLRLSGKLVYSDGTPVANAILKMKGRKKREVPVAANGHFRIEGVSSRIASSYRVELPVAPAVRPKAAQRHVFTFHPDEASDGEASVQWTIPTYRWLVLGISEQDRVRLAKQRPYPVYLLQKKAQIGWQDIPADVFLEQPDGLAISLTQNGDYRGVVALSPYFYAYSEAVAVTHTDQEIFLPMNSLFQVAAPSYHLKVSTGGEAMSDVPVAVLGVHSSLPPFQGKTDSAGRLPLGPVNSPTLFITIGEDEYQLPLSSAHGFELEIKR